MNKRVPYNPFLLTGYCVFFENAYGYQELLNAYTDVQVNILRAIAKEKVVAQINSGDFITKYRLKNASSVSRALKKLIDNELVYKSENGYVIYDRFLGLWLCNQ